MPHIKTSIDHLMKSYSLGSRCRWIVKSFIMVILASSGIPDAKSAQPNIILILVDDLRHDVFSFNSHPFIETPHIDSLVQNGTLFRNAFVTTSLCSPSRASFLTGRYMHNHKVVNNVEPMPEGTVTFPKLLKNAGYETGFIGKWHMGGSSDEPRKGFSHWVSFRGQGTYQPDNQTLNVNGTRVNRTKYMTDELTDYAVNWLREQSEEKPFLLYLSHKGVHGLYEPAERHRDLYQNKRTAIPPDPHSASQANEGKPMWVQDQRNSWHGVEFPYYGRSKQSVAEMYQHYCEMILSIDESLGVLMQELRRKKMETNTLVIFTSDGGHLWGEHGLIDKRCAYEESIRIPLIAYGPGIVAKGEVSDAMIANIDVAPTLLGLANLSIPDWIDGKSFRELLSEPVNQHKERASLLYEYYWEPQYPQTPTTFCLRNQRFKFIQYHGIWDTDELYDLEKDPEESVNLINHEKYKGTVKAMRLELHQKLKESNGLSISLGFKRDHGANQRNAKGSKRASFPKNILKPFPEEPSSSND